MIDQEALKLAEDLREWAGDIMEVEGAKGDPVEWMAKGTGYSMEAIAAFAEKMRRDVAEAATTGDQSKLEYDTGELLVWAMLVGVYLGMCKRAIGTD